jgi:hypothetical protein
MQQQGRKKKMTEEKPYICPPPEADGNYKYYIVGSNIPVRIGSDEKGRICIGEAADKDRPGQLKVSNYHIGVILKDEDVREITKEGFIQACEDYVEYWKRSELKKKPPVPRGLNK